MPAENGLRSSTYSNIAKCILVFLLLLPMLADAESRQERESWTYHKDLDKLNNLNYSYARSPMPKRGPYEDIRLEVTCKENTLQLIAKTSSFITSQNREFGFEYQIDQNSPISLKMKTFADSKRQGYTSEQVNRIANELIAGQSVFISIHTLISTVLSAVITLDGAVEPIQKVLTDCGFQTGKAARQLDYQLTDFEHDFNALSPEKKLQALEQIKKIMDNFR